jgi:hypothetical protein
MALSAFFMVAALILFVLAAFNVGSPRFSLGWMGAACATAALLLGRVL